MWCEGEKMNFDKISIVERESLPDRIAEILRKLIISGELKPGTRLLEQDLSHQLGVSRAVLRESLRTLQEEGLVEARHNHGKYVAQIDQQDMYEIYSLRKVLECFAIIEVIKNCDKEEFEQINQMVDKTINAAKEGNYEKANDYDLKWHKQLWKLSKNERLYNFLSGMEAQLRLFLTINSYLYENLMDGVVLHREIMDAIIKRDQDLACKLMEEHIEEAIETLLHSSSVACSKAIKI